MRLIHDRLSRGLRFKYLSERSSVNSKEEIARRERVIKETKALLIASTLDGYETDVFYEVREGKLVAATGDSAYEVVMYVKELAA